MVRGDESRMTCHCGSCEDHRPSSYGVGMGALSYYMENEEARNEAYKKVMEFMDNKDGTISPDGLAPKGNPPKRGSSVEFPPAPGGWQWSDGISEKTKEVVEKALEPIVKQVEELAPASLEELAWESYTEPVNMIRKEKCYISVSEEDDRFKVTIRRQGNIIYEQRTGIETCYLAHLSEDFLIPLRNLLEALGFDVEERYDRI